MPLMYVEHFANGVQLGLWRMTESSAGILARRPRLAAVVDDVSSEMRRLERLCVHELIYSMTGDEELMVWHDKKGTPLLNGYSVSISHTHGYCAVLLSDQPSVPLGVDIEYVSHRVEKVRARFVRPDEVAEGMVPLLVNWCAKEAAYKFFEGQELDYFDMSVDQSNPNDVCVVNLKTRELMHAVCDITPQYVLVYSRQIAVAHCESE